MRSFPITLVLALVASFVLTGCIGGDDDTPESGQDGDLADEAKATAETGSITGQVVTNELEVIAGASVGLVSGGSIVEDTPTDKQGKFTFNGVEPGAYRVQVSSVCCKGSQKDVTVVAGEVADISFQLARLTKDDLQVPYMQEEVWEGFISCGIGTGVVSAAACSLTEDTPAEDPNEEFLLEFPVFKGLREFVVVMDWEPVGGVSGGEFSLAVENEDCGFNSCSYEYADLRGAPPLRADIDEASISNADWKWSAIEDNRTLQFRVFASSGTATVAYQQPFSVYYTQFFYQEAPADYDPVPDA